MRANHIAPGATAFNDALAGDLVVGRISRVDFLDVLHIERTCLSEPWPYSAFGMFVNEPAFPVATRGDEVFDYIVADVMPNHGSGIDHVKDLTVRPEARGDGLSWRLLVQSLTAVAITGATVVKFKVRVSSDPAIGLCRSLGFEPARRVPSYYDDGEDAYVMILDVAEWQRARQDRS